MAITAEEVVVEIRARTDRLEAAMRGAATTTDSAMSQIEQSAGRAEAAIRKQSNSIATSSVAAANAQRGLGSQIASIGSQLSSGSSPLQILADQAPVAANALAQAGGTAGTVAAFFAGPWGAAILGAAAVLGTLVSKLFDAEDAHKAVEKAAAAAAEAEKNLQAVLAGTIQSSERARIAALDRANASKLAALAAVNEAKAQLSLQRALLQKANEQAVGGRALNAGAQGVAQAQEQRTGDAQQKLDQAQLQLNALEIQVRNLNVAATAARSIEAKEKQDKADREAAAAQRKADAAARRAQADSARATREAERAAKGEARARRQAANDIGRSQNELLAAEADLTTDTRLRDEVLRQRIVNERDRAKNDIDANPIYTDKERERPKDLEDQIARSKLNKVTLDAGERLIRDELTIRQAQFDNERDALQIQGDLATTLAERREIALRLVDLAYQQERAQLEAVLASKTATEAERKIAEARLAVLGQLEAGDKEVARRRNEGPLAQYRRQFEDLDTAIEQVEVDALRKLEDGLTRATVKALGLKGALGDIVGELIRIGIQRAIIGPLADALFGAAGGGGGGGGIFGSVLGAFGFGGSGGGGRGGLASGFVDPNPNRTFEEAMDDFLKGKGIFGSQMFLSGRASGGYVSAGQFYRVNEGASPGRVEGFRPQGSGTIIPLGRMNAAVPSSAPVINQTFVLDARYGITTPELLTHVNNVARTEAKRAGVAAYDQSMRDAPTAVSRARRFGVSG